MGKRANEPAVWFLFGTGGFVAGYLLPVHILLFGILFPLGVFTGPGYEGVLHLVEHPLVRLYFMVLFFFGFFHAAHRLRLTLVDFLRIKHLETALGMVLYTAAALCTLTGVYLALTV
ncbi:MAG TPA: fumarate reductase subunit FrdD [Candidatus Binataceae bacterium]|jgi:succinate dehydrogenase subunit D|nr:fumarate reductase subunit FrdD [Candidatus Binataceae bacterium]